MLKSVKIPCQLWRYSFLRLLNKRHLGTQSTLSNPSTRNHHAILGPEHRASQDETLFPQTLSASRATTVSNVQAPRRHYSVLSSPICHSLVKRGLIRITGGDAMHFLQGLLTNDMKLLSDECDPEDRMDAMYTMMLNQQGRVLYDLILYRLTSLSDHYLMECDLDVIGDLLQSIKRYRMRKKVSVDDVSDEYKVYAVLAPDGTTEDSPVTLTLPDNVKVIASVADPRLPWFGNRVITKDDVAANALVPGSRVHDDDLEYTRQRYMVGLSEGTIDLPPGNCTPLESNAVFMNGVSFSKGCYIGQELTARTHHTGVIRKRLMPVNIIGVSSKPPPGTTVENSRGKNCGKFRNSVDSHGLALLRLKDVIGQELVVKEDDIVVKMAAFLPSWWPRDSDEIIKQCLDGK